MRVIKKYLELIKFSHTVFALPFALTSVVVAAGGLPPNRVVGWVVAAAVAARTMAMSFNRIVDIDFDRLNPRAAGRPTVTGEVSLRGVWILWGVSSLLFFVSAWRLNPACLALSPFVWMVLNGYSLTKRFTDWTHLVLGLALGLAPMGAWVAVTGRIEWDPLPLGLGVLFWVAGFDIIYALQDEEVDLKTGLHSLVTRMGARKALRISRLFHVLAIGALVLFGGVQGLGTFYHAGVGVVAAALFVEQSLVSPEDRSRIGVAFFTANGFISLSFMVTTGLDVFLR